jgi:hypothetical protein
MQVWDDASKPWDKRICEARYVLGEDAVDLRSLGAESGNHLKTLSTWCKRGEWVEKRRQYAVALASAITQKNIDVISAAVEPVLGEQYRAAKLMRESGTKFIRAFSDSFEAVRHGIPLTEIEENLLKYCSSLGGKNAIASYGRLLADGIELERKCLGIDMVFNAAHLRSYLNARGMDLIRSTPDGGLERIPDDEILPELGSYRPDDEEG